jgi:hypothetical protein
MNTDQGSDSAANGSGWVLSGKETMADGPWFGCAGPRTRPCAGGGKGAQAGPESECCRVSAHSQIEKRKTFLISKSFRVCKFISIQNKFKL